MANTIAGAFNGRDNNFNLIRFLAASAVLVDHSFALVPSELAAASPIDLRPLRDRPLGRRCVLHRLRLSRHPQRHDAADAGRLRRGAGLAPVSGARRRLRRPGLRPRAVVTLVSPLDYFADPRPWLYVPLTASLVTHSLTLPGVFDTVPEAGIVNSPLWTLRYEAFCYLLLALFAAAGLFWSRARAGSHAGGDARGLRLVTFATDWRAQSSAIDSTLRFLLDFFLGGALYHFRREDQAWPRRGGRRLAAVALLAYATPAFEAARADRARLWRDLVRAGAGRRHPRLQSRGRLLLRHLHHLLPDPAEPGRC